MSQPDPGLGISYCDDPRALSSTPTTRRLTLEQAHAEQIANLNARFFEAQDANDRRVVELEKRCHLLLEHNSRLEDVARWAEICANAIGMVPDAEELQGREMLRRALRRWKARQ